MHDRSRARLLPLLLLAALALLAPTAGAAHFEALFRPVGDLEGGQVRSELWGVSGDGRVAVGLSSQTNGIESVMYKDGELVGLGQLPATGLSLVGKAWDASRDGSVIVGWSRSQGGNEAYRWTEATGLVALGDLPGGLLSSRAFAVSGDGSTVVGKGDVENSPGEAWVWTEATGMQGLGDLPGGAYNSDAQDISADGSVIAGFSLAADAAATTRWIDLVGPSRLDSLQPGGLGFNEARGISADGDVIVGFSASANTAIDGREACRWVDGVPEGLGDLPGGAFHSTAFATNEDGSVVVGQADTGLGDPEAFIWTERDGMRSLKELLETRYEADLTGWQLIEARGISDDGHTIVGWGLNPDGNREGFVIRLPTVARMFDEALLDLIRVDYPAPTVHSRNLFHLSAAMWDVWSAYKEGAQGFYSSETATADNLRSAREEGIAYAAYRLLDHRFTEDKSSPFAVDAKAEVLDGLMDRLGYDPAFTATDGGVRPAAELGNRVAAAIIAHGSSDGANEDDPDEPYSDPTYFPVNTSTMKVDLPGVTQPPDPTFPAPELVDPNRWQPLALEFLILQNGIIIGAAEQTFLGSRWGQVTPFALVRDDPNDVYDDPGPPPFIGCPGDVHPCPGDTAFKENAVGVIEFASWLDPSDGVEVDISPGAIGNNPLGTHDGTGFAENPFTGEPYEPNVVKRGDWGRILAEFWADGPDSETPPGHWNTISNYVSDHPLVEKRWEGQGPTLDALEWDVKLYFAVNGAVFDAAIAAWDAKRKYDYVRPITQIRYMGGKGQSTDPLGDSYHPHGLPLVPGLIEVMTDETTAPGGRHEFVKNIDPFGFELPTPPVGQIAIRSWPGQPEDPDDFSGVEWIRAIDWLPYQRETFVTPPFAGYTSGHSTFSRAAAEVLTRVTGSMYFPGGLGEFVAEQGTFLAFETGPTEEIVLQWATYYDAADEAGISRLWGGIHVSPDDFGGRIMGADVGIDAYDKAITYFAPEPSAAAQVLAVLLSLQGVRRWRRRARG